MILITYINTCLVCKLIQFKIKNHFYDFLLLLYFVDDVKATGEIEKYSIMAIVVFKENF